MKSIFLIVALLATVKSDPIPDFEIQESGSQPDQGKLPEIQEFGTDVQGSDTENQESGIDGRELGTDEEQDPGTDQAPEIQESEPSSPDEDQDGSGTEEGETDEDYGTGSEAYEEVTSEAPGSYGSEYSTGTYSDDGFDLTGSTTETGTEDPSLCSQPCRAHFDCSGSCSFCLFQPAPEFMPDGYPKVDNVNGTDIPVGICVYLDTEEV